MRILGLIIAIVSMTPCGIGEAQTRPATPVVIELFTAEGCSSCPPADALLTAVAEYSDKENREIIALGEHVDYWNDSGWVDHFSSPLFTERQRTYAWRFNLASPYTPQMIVDGRVQFLGNNRSAVEGAIADASTQSKPAIINIEQVPDDQIRVTVRNVNARGAQVMLAIIEYGLTTDVRAGENKGRTLHHAPTVRELRSMGTISKESFSATTGVDKKPDWNPDNLRIAVFVQEKRQGPIIGAASIKYLPATRPSSVQRPACLKSRIHLGNDCECSTRKLS
jgi:hypothetical protein